MSTRAIKIGCQANAWEREVKFAGTGTLELIDRALAETAAAGFDGTEMPTRSVPDLNKPDELRALVSKHGLALIGLHLGGAFYDEATYRERSLPALRAAATCAAAAGAEGMIISGAPKRERSPAPGVRGATLRKTADELRAQTRTLSELYRLLRDLGLTPWYHNHGHEFEFEFEREDLHSILEVDEGLVSLCFDMGNAARVVGEGEALLSVMEELWPRIGYLHYRDLVGRRSPEALGDGTLDFEEIGRFATSRGFSGWAVVELDSSAWAGYTRTPLGNVRISCEIMRRTLGVPG